MTRGGSKHAALGLAMVLEHVRVALADRALLKGVYLRQEGGRHGDALGAALLLVPVPGGGFELSRYSVTGEAHQARGTPQGVDEAGGIAAVETALTEAGNGASLAVMIRGSAVEFRLDGRGMRRMPLAPGRDEQLLALRSAQSPRRAKVSPAAADQAGGDEDSDDHGWAAPPERLAPGGGGPVLDPVAARPLLRAIGLLGPDGFVRRDQRRKYNQIVYLAEDLKEAISTLPRNRELLFVDCGCGKSQLLLVLNYLATEELGLRARFVGIDIDPAATARAERLRGELGYANMEYVASAVRSWRAPEHIDVVLSLHACDTATDEALALGVVSRARVIIAVPCCHAEVAAQVSSPLLDPVLGHGTLRARFGDWLTEALRVLTLESHGYEVRVSEYVSPLDTPKNLMILARAGDGSAAARDRAARARRAAQRLADELGADPSLPRLIEAMSAERGR